MNPECEPQTSLMMFRSLTPEWKATKRAIVYNAILYYGPICRERLCEVCGMKGNTLRPRVLELIKEGLVEVDGVTVYNGHQVELLHTRET